ncbi:hypothetical protein JAAARDRAFT_125858, partial [Jaapia argillacea MUCL 33604]
MLSSKWSYRKIRKLVWSKFHKRACLFQMRVAKALFEERKDVVSVAATGMGKTLSFWIPLLMALEENQDKIIIVITPLNILGKQNVDLLKRVGISGVAIDASNSSDATFKEVEAGQHRVIVVNPEILMEVGGHFEKLWKKSHFTSKLLYIVFDEGHCISEWSEFRNQYKHVGSLRYLIPDMVPFYVTSATLPTATLADVSDILQLRSPRLIFRSNNRPTIAIAVHRIQHTMSSFEDLDFLIPRDIAETGNAPPKFLVFFDDRKEAENAAKHLQNLLPDHLRDKVKHFHSVMSDTYRDKQFKALGYGDLFGLCVTDSFGMGLDLPDIAIVVQWRAPKSIIAVWQRFGRAARGDDREGFAILLAEPSHFDEDREKARLAADKRRERAAKKRKSGKPATDPPAKRRTTSNKGSEHQLVPTSNEDQQEQEGRDQDEAETKMAVLDPAVDDLINAGARKLNCRRRVINLVFRNDERG